MSPLFWRTLIEPREETGDFQSGLALSIITITAAAVRWQPNARWTFRVKAIALTTVTWLANTWLAFGTVVVRAPDRTFHAGLLTARTAMRWT